MLASAATCLSAQTKTATTTTFAVTAGGTAATSIASGTVVTLTAAVSAGPTAITRGQVNFCDASATYCTDIHILGMAQITSAGTATLKLRPSIGSHSYKAVFLGTNAYAGGASGTSALTVTSIPTPMVTDTTIAESGSWGNYTLTANVTEAGGTTAPTGAVSFLDASNGNSILAAETLGAAVSSIGWPNPMTMNVSGGFKSQTISDLNGDGIPDLVVNANSVAIYLGNADGTYTEAPVPSISGPTGNPMIIADFNGDGIPDLAVAMYASSTISVLLGKGDGTFAAPGQVSLSNVGANISQLTTADFNGDGIADLAVIDNSDSRIDIFLGNGDGTFQSPVSPSISMQPSSVATGDFNGDGKTDIAVGDTYSDSIAILLGNGDGTFTTADSVHSGTQNAQIAIADFNGDGKVDLAVAAGGSSGTGESVTILTGLGNGNFSLPSSVQGTSLSAVTSLRVADFNRDGAPDVVLADSNGNVSVLLNNGSGSFSASIPVVTGLDPFPGLLSVGDLNGDGYTDIAASVQTDGTLRLYLTQPMETATASANVSLPPGIHNVAASYSGDSNYSASASSTTPLWGIPPETMTSLSVTAGGSSVTSVAPGTVVTLTATVAAGTSPATAGQVNFCDATAAHCTDVHIVGTAMLTSSGTAIYRFVPGAGDHSYKAVFIENGYGGSSFSSPVSLSVGPARSPVYTDTSAIAFNGASGDYSLTATLVGYGGTAPLTGTLSFLDTSFGNASLGTTSVGASTRGVGWLSSQTPALSGAPSMEAQGDFNGDGIPDLALLSTSAPTGPYSVTLFFGTGNGTFTTGPAIVATGVQSPPYMITSDFNGDGKTDLAILSAAPGYDAVNIAVMLNNGDGTFAAPQTTQISNIGGGGGVVVAASMVAADFNGDGKMDLAAVGGLVASGRVTILLGNGDGTFTSSGASYGQDSSFSTIATGDFNGDGIPDLVAANYGSSAAVVLLGKGNGKFAVLPTQIPVNTFVQSIAVGDFNGDGLLDLAFRNNSGVEVYLGNGSGIFTESYSSPILGASAGLVACDFNRDGTLDLAAIDSYYNQIDVYIGIGDGTFTKTVATPNVTTSFGTNAIVSADFNGDGTPDLAMTIQGADSASILLNVPTETAVWTVTGLAPIGAGTHNVDVSYSGDSNYPASTSPTVELTAGLAPLIISPAGGASFVGQQITISESVPGATIYYYALGAGLNTHGYVPYTGPISLNQSGILNLQAYATETGYASSTYVATNFTVSTPVATAVATVSVTPSVANLINTQTLTVVVGVNGTSGQPTPTGSVTLSTGSWSEQQTLSGGNAAFTVPAGTLSTGSNTLTASYSGDTIYAVASGTATVTVAPVVSTGQTPSAISPGGSATSTIAFSASAGYSGTLNLTCALTSSPNGAQSLPTCNMKPTSITLTSGANGASTLTVTTTAAGTTARVHPLGGPMRWFGGGGATLAMLLLFGIPTRRRRWTSLFVLLLAFSISAFGVIGCGGGNSGGGMGNTGGNNGGGGGGGVGGGGGGQTIPATTAGNYTFTVTGTDSVNPKITTSTTVVVTVQ